MIQEAPKIDLQTLGWLTCKNPDTARILFDHESEDPARCDLSIITDAVEFVTKYGPPPWRYLGLVPKALCEVSNPDERALREWVFKSPLRQIEIPFGERTITMMVSNPDAEDKARINAAHIFIGRFMPVFLPELKDEDCLLKFRTDKWINTTTGKPSWVAIDRNGRTGEKDINLSIVKCVQAITALAGEYYDISNPT